MNAVMPKISRWRWPALGVISGPEVLLACSLLAVLNALALRAMSENVMRARSVEVLVALGEARYDVVERAALSGEPFDLPSGSGEVARPRSITELLGRLPPVVGAPPSEGEAAGPDTGTARGTVDLVRERLTQNVTPGEAQERAGGRSKYVDELRIEGSAILARGRIAGGEVGYDFAFVPLVQDLPQGRVPQVVAWQCDPRAMPAGWTGPTVHLAHPPPQGWLPRLCRPAPTAR